MSENTIFQQQILFAADSPANLIQFAESEKPPLMKEISGLSSPVLFAIVNLTGCWLKMYQGYFQAKMDGSLVEFLQTWPPAGIVSNGKAFRLHRLVRRISVRGSSLLPTMRASENCKYQYHHGNHNKKVLTLTGYVNLYPTPNTTRFYFTNTGKTSTLQGMANGQLNPTWVEWFMGFPIGWTEINHSEIP